jgi:hypothetical protein
MAQLVGHSLTGVGDTTDIHLSQRNPVGLRAFDATGNEYVYMQGVASVVLGTWVVYDELFITTRTAANALGAVAIARAAIDATTSFGWFAIYGSHTGLCLANYADNAKVWCTSTAGQVDDADVAVDLIINAVGRSARSATTGLATFQICYPFALNEVYN